MGMANLLPVTRSGPLSGRMTYASVRVQSVAAEGFAVAVRRQPGQAPTATSAGQFLPGR